MEKNIIPIDNISMIMSNLYGIIDKILSFLSMKDINKCAVLNSVWNNSVGRIRQKRCKLFSKFYQLDVTKKEFREKFRKDIDELWIYPICYIFLFYPTKYHDFKWAAYKSLITYLPVNVSSIALQTYGIIDSNNASKREQPLNSIKCELIAIPKIDKFSVIPFYIFEESSEKFLHSLALRDSDIVLNKDGDIIYGNVNALSNVKLFLISFDKDYDDTDEDEGTEGSASLCHLIPKCLINKYQAVVAGYISFCPAVSVLTPNSHPIAQGLAFCGSGLAVSSTVLTSHISTRSRISHSLDLLQNHFRSFNDDSNMYSGSGKVDSKTTYIDPKKADNTRLISGDNNEAEENFSRYQIATNEASLEQQNDTPKLNKQILSFSFMISCISRPDVLKREKGVNNIDLVIFKEKFPNLVVNGFLAGGEIGHDHVFAKNETNQTIEVPSKLQHSFSTVFVILSVFDSEI